MKELFIAANPSKWKGYVNHANEIINDLKMWLFWLTMLLPLLLNSVKNLKIAVSTEFKFCSRYRLQQEQKEQKYNQEERSF